MPPARPLATLAAALVAAALATPAWAQDCATKMCLPGYTAQEVPLPGTENLPRSHHLHGRMTCRCMPNWSGSAPSIGSADPTRRSTVILSLAGPVTVNGCGMNHQTMINIRATGGFFATGQAALVSVSVSSDFTDDGFDFENDAGLIDGGFVRQVMDGDNVFPFRHKAAPHQGTRAGKHTISLRLVDRGLNTEKTWTENVTSYTQKYRIAPTGGVQVTFDLDGPGC